MALKDRSALKSLFKNGSKPTASHFEDLIDSVVNKIDDNWNILSNKNVMPVGTNDTQVIISKQFIDPSAPGTNSLTVPADGEWYQLFSAASGLQSFEIIAAGVGSTGYFCMLYAIALYGIDICTIKEYNAFMGPRIKLRWTGTLQQHNLEVRSSGNLGMEASLKLSIRPIWT